MGRDFGTKDEVIAVMDAGPLGYLSIAAHGHADCLAFTLAVAGRAILIDPGTYCYHSEPEWRDYFRGTAAHNTVRVDGCDQSEIGGAFMWLSLVEQIARGEVVIRSGPVVVTLHCADGDVRILRGSLEPRSGWISRRFGTRSPTTTVIIGSLTHGSARLSTTFAWTVQF